MNKQSRIGLAVALAALAGIAGWKIFQVFREKEPAYGGKELTVWLRTYQPVELT